MLRLGQAHGGENCGSNIAQHGVAGVLEAPALGGVGHDEGDLVGGMASLGLAIGKLHLLGVAVVRRDEQDVALLLAPLEDLANGLVTGLDANNSGIVL